MKNLVLICFSFMSINVWAQNLHNIENEIVKIYKKLSYLAVQSKYDSSEIENGVLGLKLKNYTAKTPSTITYPFSLLSKDLDISSSNDGMFRIYSWDMLTGGTMHFFANVFQYKYGLQTFSFFDKPGPDGDNRPNYFKMHTFKANGQNYYLAVYLTISSSKDAGEGIHIFSIENGKLIEPKIIKTQQGITNKLYYDYDFFSVVDLKIRPSIQFDSKSGTIKLPLVSGNEKVTNKFITYKFTGQYFEKVKN